MQLMNVPLLRQAQTQAEDATLFKFLHNTTPHTKDLSINLSEKRVMLLQQHFDGSNPRPARIQSASFEKYFAFQTRKCNINIS